MPINFPSSPSTNDKYTYSDKSWTWNGAAWERSVVTETGNTEGNTGEVAYYSGKGSIIAGATAFFYDGDKVGIGTSGPTQVLDVRGGITASGGLYVGGSNSKFAGGATFDHISLETDSIITDGGSNPIFKIAGDRWVIFGDTNDSGNSTKLSLKDGGAGIATLTANSIVLESQTIKVLDDIEHSGDTNTKINFVTDRIDFIAGGVTGARIAHLGADRMPPCMLEAPFGLTCGIESSGRIYGNIYTPAGVTCDSLAVGGYWAGQHEEIIGINVDNGTSVLTTGVKGHRTIPYNCEIVDWRVTSTDSGAIEWGINYATYANFPTFTANAIHPIESPGIAASGSKDESNSESDIAIRWTKYQFDAGDIIQFEIDSVTTLTNCNLAIKIRRNG